MSRSRLPGANHPGKEKLILCRWRKAATRARHLVKAQGAVDSLNGRAMNSKTVQDGEPEKLAVVWINTDV